MIYNEDIKNLYLQKIEDQSTYKAIQTYFNNSADIEQLLGKDIANFNLSDIIGYYKSLGTASTQYLATINSRFVAYTNWCLEGKLVADNQNHFREIHRKELEECINKHLFKKEVVTKDELLKLIKRQELDVGENFLILALYEGISGKEYIEIRNLYYQDFIKNKVNLCTGRTLDVSDKLIELAEESSRTFTFLTADGKERNLAPDDKRCFKFPERTNVESLYITRKLGLIKKTNDYLYIGGKELKESGRINMIREIMKENDWTAEVAIKNRREEIEYRYGHLMSISAYVNDYKEFLT